MFRWIFVIADIRTPIIGADFLREYGLLVNMKHGQLVDMTTNLQSQDIMLNLYAPLSILSRVVQNMTPYWLNFLL